MKEALGGVSIFQIVIVFILVFTGIMCLTINHSKAFGVKDEVITIIQNEEIEKFSYGASYTLSSETIKEITELLNEAGYRITGDCPSGYTGYDRNGSEVKKNASFCVKANNVVDNAYVKDLEKKCANNKCIVSYGDYPSMVYYDIVLFYQLDIPIINDIMNFKITGSTKVLVG